jgi:hypothetical protein
VNVTDEELARLRREAETTLKSRYPGVLGVGYGYKQVAGRTTTRLAFRVYVEQKRDRGAVPPSQLIPPELFGIPTDVLTISKDVAFAGCEDVALTSPLLSGVNVSNMKTTASGVDVGTVGFFATIDGMAGPENVALVSNVHVLGAGGAVKGDTVYQPKFFDNNGVATIDPRESVALGKIHELPDKKNYDHTYPEGTSKFYVDAATARLNICISTWCHTNCGTTFRNEVKGLDIGGKKSIAAVNRVKASDLPAGGEYIVYKVGRETGLTRGKVVDVAGTTADPVTLDLHEGVIMIEPLDNDCTGQRRFAFHGDSGAPLINSAAEIVGLVFGGPQTGGGNAFACHIHPVLAQTKVTAITTAAPHSAESTSASVPVAIADSRPDMTQQLRSRFFSTRKGREIDALLEAHRHEVVHLVNHCRPVTVAWHRHKGPAFVNRLANNARDPGSKVPAEIDGIRRETLLRTMADVLTRHGSPALRRAIALHRTGVLGMIDSFDSLHDLVDRLEAVEAA